MLRRRLPITRGTPDATPAGRTSTALRCAAFVGLSGALVVVLSGVYAVPWQVGVADSNQMTWLTSLMWLVSELKGGQPLFTPIVAAGLVAVGGVSAVWPTVGGWLRRSAFYIDLAVVLLSGSRLLFGAAVGAGSTAKLTWGTANLVLLIGTLVMGVLPLMASLRIGGHVGEPSETDRLRWVARRAGVINLALAAVLFGIYGSLGRVQVPLYQNLILAGCQPPMAYPRHPCDPLLPPPTLVLASSLFELLLVPVTAWLLASSGVLLGILARCWSPRPRLQGA